MLKIGLAGGSGSGKGRVSALLALAGIPSFDCDAVYHELISRDGTLSRELADAFGDEILSRAGGVDRAALREAAFHDPEKRARLNAITHRHVLRELREWVDRAEKQGVTAVVVDAPLLFESGFDRECDLTVAVTAPVDLRVERIVRRDGITPDAARERVDAQIPDADLTRRADLVIENGGDQAQLSLEVSRILKIINERRK